MHYADGTEARVGDLVKGTAYNTKDAAGAPRVIVGTMLQIIPGSETCNCIVGFVEQEDASIEALAKHYAETPKLMILNGPRYVFLSPKSDYGECKAFELVHRPSP